MTMACSPTCLKAAYEPRANGAFTATPFTVTARSVRGIPTRNTSPACSWPDLPRACSTAFQSGSAARATPAPLTIRAIPKTRSARDNTGDLMVTASSSARVRLVQARDVVPANVLHEGVHILRRGGTVVKVVGVLVHVQGEDWRAAGQAMRVVRGPLVHQPPAAGGVRQQNPSRPPAHGLAHRDELGPPALDAPKVTREGLAQRRIGLAALAEAVEVQLVQNHRVRCDQLLSLEAVDGEHGRRGHVERAELGDDRVEAPDRPAVVVLVVADDQSFREAIEFPRLGTRGLHVIRHADWTSSRGYRTSKALPNRSAARRATPTAPPPTISGSGRTRHREMARTVASKTASARGSGAAWGSIAASDTAMAPITAGATPRMKARTQVACFTRLRAGITDSIMTNEGRKIATAATAAPATPATL